MQSSFKLAIFDFDGTLANSFPWFAGVVNTLATVHQFRHIDPNEVDHLRSLETSQLLNALEVPRWKLPRIAVHLRKLMAEQSAQIPLFAGVDVFLERLSHQGVGLAMVSSNAESVIRAVLGPKLAALFRSYDCGLGLWGKASRLRRLVKRSSINGQQAVYVGDEIRDIQAARQAGIRSAAVTWGYATPAALTAHIPDTIVTTFDELAQHICPSGHVS